MMLTIRTMLLLFTACLLCLPVTGFACDGPGKAVQHSCCAKDRTGNHWCEKGQAESQHSGQDCNGSCAGSCHHHSTEFSVLPVALSLQPGLRPNKTAERWSYAEDYSFTDFQLIWTPPKNKLS